MAQLLKRPTDPYDPSWVEYAKQNPGLRRSLSAADGADDFDTSFIPESFKQEDGTFDTASFRTSYDEAVTFKTQADEATALLPKDADGYVFALGEDFKLPEGFTLPQVPNPDVDGEMMDFDIKTLLDADDPDIKAAQSLLHEFGAKGELSGKLAELMVGRDLRQMQEANTTAAAERAALGPTHQARIDTLKNAVEAVATKEEATAIMDSLTSADAVRAMEKIIGNSKKPVIPGGGNKPDMDNMSNMELLELGNQQKKRA